MKHPILLALGAGLAVLFAAFATALWQIGRNPAPTPAQSLPWQVEARADGTSQVFGLVLGRDTLAVAEARIGDGLQVALVAHLGEVGVLEALVDPFSAGFVSGRLVLALDVPEATLRRWRERAPRSAVMDGGARRFELHADDRDEARRAPIAGVSFVPALRLAEADVRQRFGAPTESVLLAPDAKVLLYPERGLAATVGVGSRGVLEYVAPRDFEVRLRGPFLASPKASAAGS